MRKLLVGSLLFISGFAQAMTNVPGGVSVEITYTEPNQNADGTPLKDLLRTTLFYSRTGLDTIDQKAFDQPASALAGGAIINRIITIPYPDNREGTVSFYAVATDTMSNTGAKSNTVTLGFDKVAPGAPRTITITNEMLNFQFREPLVNADGTPITDLAQAKIYYNDSVSAAVRLLGTFPVTGNTGGGAQTASFPIAMFIPGSKVQLFARFLDDKNNQSAFPAAIAVQIPK